MSDGHDDGKQDTMAEQDSGRLSFSEQRTNGSSHVSEVTEQSAPTSPDGNMGSNGERLERRSIAESPVNDQEGKDDASYQTMSSDSGRDKPMYDENSDTLGKPISRRNASASSLESRRSSPQQRVNPSVGNKQHDDEVEGQPPMSNALPLSKRRKARSLSPVDVARAQTLHQLEQEEDEASPSSKESGTSLHGIDSPVAPLDEPSEDTPENEKDEVGNDGLGASIQSSDVVLSETIAGKEELEDPFKVAGQTLRTVQEGKERLKRDHDKLSVRSNELQEQITGPNSHEPELPKLAMVEAERNKLREKAKDLELKLKKKCRELAEKDVDIKNATEYACGVQDELNAANEKARKVESGVSAVCSTMEQWAQSMSRLDENIDWNPLLDFIGNVAKDVETKELREHFGKFSHGVYTRTQALERELNKKVHELSMLKNAKVAEEDEKLAVSPLSPRWNDRASFESLFKEEQAKRKAAEQRLEKIQADVEMECNQKIKKLQDDLTRTQEENKTLSQKFEECEGRVNYLKEDVEAANSRLQEREDAFEKQTQEQQEEIHQYIKEYYGRLQDPIATCLQKQLTAKQEELAATNKSFKKIDRENVGLRDQVDRLEKSNNLLEIEMREIFQLGQGLPLHSHTMIPGYRSKEGTSSQSSSLSASPESGSPRQVDGDQSPFLQDAQQRRKAILADQKEQNKAMLAEQMEARRKAREDDATLDKIIEKLRERRMGEFYPPRQMGWREAREKSAWERWGGDEWAKKHPVTYEEERVLRAKGLWPEETA